MKSHLEYYNGDMENKLVTWIKNELNARDWSIRKLSREAGISHSFITEVINGQKSITLNFCIATAKGFNEPTWKFLVMAGLLEDVPNQVAEDEKTRLLLKIFNDLPPKAQDEALSYLKWLAIRNQNPI